MLPCDSLLPLFYIKKLGLAVYLLKPESFLVNTLAFHLPRNNRPFKRDDTKVMAICSLHNHHITGLDALAGHIHVNGLPCILEPDFKIVFVLFLLHSGKPVINFKLAAPLTVAAIKLSSFKALNRTSPRAVIFFRFLIVVHSCQRSSGPGYMFVIMRFTRSQKSIFELTFLSIIATTPSISATALLQNLSEHFPAMPE